MPYTCQICNASITKNNGRGIYWCDRDDHEYQVDQTGWAWQISDYILKNLPTHDTFFIIKGGAGRRIYESGRIDMNTANLFSKEDIENFLLLR